jgi:hypothetical protein
MSAIRTERRAQGKPEIDLDTDVPPDQASRGLTAEQPARHGALLQHLDRQGEVPDDGGWLLGFPDPSHDHQACVQTQAGCQALLSRVPSSGRHQPLVQPPRSQHGSPGVILLGH